MRRIADVMTRQPWTVQDSIVQLAREHAGIQGPLDLHAANRASIYIWQRMRDRPDALPHP
jgi:hypothetical protein